MLSLLSIGAVYVLIPTAAYKITLHFTNSRIAAGTAALLAIPIGVVTIERAFRHLRRRPNTLP